MYFKPECPFITMPIQREASVFDGVHANHDIKPLVALTHSEVQFRIVDFFAYHHPKLVNLRRSLSSRIVGIHPTKRFQSHLLGQFWCNLAVRCSSVPKSSYAESLYRLAFRDNRIDDGFTDNLRFQLTPFQFNTTHYIHTELEYIGSPLVRGFSSSTFTTHSWLSTIGSLSTKILFCSIII